MKNNQFSKVEAFRYFLLAAQRQGNRILNDLLKEIGLTASQAEVIRILADWKSLTLKELGQLLICETGSPSRLIERMYQDGLVEKIVDPKDSRYVVLQLTIKGLEKSKTIEDIEKQLYKPIMQIYSENELDNISSLLMRFLEDQPVADTLKKRGFWRGKKL
jgi:DNA-binding MarR family transcriptional regulator